MEFEEAIVLAIGYEEKLRDVYREAADTVSDPLGKSILNALGEDEQAHADYLKSKLESWRKTGKLDIAALDSVIPQREVIEEQATRHSHALPRDARGDEKQVLSRALRIEVETSRFYKKMVAEMPGEVGGLFAEFLKIEDRHIAAVQAELDYYSKTGYWFGIKEFDME